MEYANKLIKAGLPVDRYGACFNNRKQDLTLDKDVLQSYEFYLAFENALHCRDYITEKFWVRSLSMGRVSVVWGPSKENVVRLAPTKSFIHVEDFDSPASLAMYLLYLDKNDTAYREYFKWREEPDEKTMMIALTRERTGALALCDRIKERRRHRSVPSIYNYFQDQEKSCLYPKTRK